MAYSIDQVINATAASWDADTSASPDLWTPEQPTLGQCVPTALVLQDYLHGLLTRVRAVFPDGNSETHYYNTDIPPHAMALDLTRGQYSPGQEFVLAPLGVEIRDYVLQHDQTDRRYTILLARVGERLAQLGEV